MEERRRRIAQNETVFREVNEQIERLHGGLVALDSSDGLPIICECGEDACGEQLKVPLSDYEHVRADPLLFIVVSGHEIPDVEDVVEQHAAYLVVRKRPDAIGGQIAVDHDPRSQ
jgi:hypothetical protein